MTIAPAGAIARNPFTLVMADASFPEPVIAPWSATSGPAMPSYGPVADAGADQPIWRVAVSSLTDARGILAMGSRELAREQAVLTEADRRFAAVASSLGNAGSVNFQGAEAELVATLVASDAVPSVSFEVESGSVDGLADRAGDWLRDTWRQMQSLIARTTWTETLVDGRLIARSALGPNGDTLTAWVTGVTWDEASLHNRAVALALASKEELLRRITLVIRGALMVTGLIAAPGSALLFIPAIWRYLNQLRAELFDA